MEFRNVLMAIVLSTVVLIGWATFFEPPVSEIQAEKNNVIKNETGSTPSIEGGGELKKIPRDESIKKVQRIKLENKNILGSISLEGGIIDDVVFKNYKELEKRFDIIFMDPPYREKKINILLNIIKENHILSSSGVVIIHRHKKDDVQITEKLKILDERTYGISRIIIGN